MAWAPRLLMSPGNPVLTLAALETGSIAAGIEALDALLKEAPVSILLAEAASPGKYLVLFTGEVEELSRSLAKAIEVAGDERIDDVLLPAPEADLVKAMISPSAIPVEDRKPPAIGVLETWTAPTLLAAADSALKTGQTGLCQVHLLSGIGGKSTAILHGDIASTRVAISAGAEVAREREALAREVLIPRPDANLLDCLDPSRRNTSQ